EGDSMHLRMYSLLAVVLVAVPLRAAEEKAPTLIVRLNSIDELMSDFRFVLEAAGKGNEAQQIEGVIKLLTGSQGIETTKPIGLYARLAQNVVESDVVVLLPVANAKTFLALLERLNIKAEKQKGDIYKVDLPNAPFAGYFRFANGYA